MEQGQSPVRKRPTTKPLGWPRPELCQASRGPLGARRLSAGGRLLSGARSRVLRTQRGPLRPDTRAALDRISTRSRALPPPPRQAFGSRRSGAGPAALPHPHCQTSLCGRRQRRGASHLPSESHTWKRRIPDCDPRPCRGPRTTSPRKLRMGHAHFRVPLPVAVEGFEGSSA